MRASLTLAALTLSAGAASAGSHGMTQGHSAGAQREAIVQCQRDLGYGAAEIRIGKAHASGAKGTSHDLLVLPGGYITPAAAREINDCAAARLSARYHQPAPQPVLRRAVPVAPVTYGCPPGAPVMYRGTLYCPRQ